MHSISSRHNPAYKALKALARDPHARREAGQTVLDGVHLIEACLAAGRVPVSLWLAEGALAKPEIVALAERLERIPRTVLSDALFKDAAPTDTPAGILAVIDLPAPVQPTPLGTVLALDGVQDAGNVGTLLRTAAAAAVDQVWLGQGCAQAWSPKVLRAGMGAHFCVKIAEGVDLMAVLSDTAQPIIATALEAGQSVFETDLRGPAVWLFGAEGRGLSAPLQERASVRVRIPMPGKIESLNVATAAAICLFEQHRQRTRASGG